VKLLLLSTGGGGGNILRSVRALFDRDLAVTEKADSRYATRLREAVTTRFLDTNEFSLADVPREERLLIGPRTTGRLGARHNPEVAKQALEESRDEVESLLMQHAIVILIGTGGKGTGAGTMFPIAQLARQHRKLLLPIFVRPSFERHEVDKRRYDHALAVIERFDAAGIRLVEIQNDRGYSDSSPQPQSVVWEQMNLPIARGLRGLLYVLWELSQVDPSDLSIMLAGNGRLRIGFADIEAPAGQEPADVEIDQAARRCWANPYYTFSRPAGTSLVCIQGDWSNVVDARIKGQLATLAMSGGTDTPYTPLYARAVYSPRPWGVTMLLSEYTGNHAPLDIDWSFASARVSTHLAHLARPEGMADRLVAKNPAALPAPAASTGPAARRAASSRERANADRPFANLLDFAAAVNRSNPIALAMVEGDQCDFPIDGADVRKLLGNLWFRTVVASLPHAWRMRLLDALRSSLELPNHTVRLGRQSAHLSELAYAQLCEAATNPSLSDAIRSDLEFMVTVGRVWGDDAPRQFRYRDVAVPATASRFASLMQGFRPKL
jgi:cell division GTPase FtsZ